MGFETCNAVSCITRLLIACYLLGQVLIHDDLPDSERQIVSHGGGIIINLLLLFIINTPVAATLWSSKASLTFFNR